MQILANNKNLEIDPSKLETHTSQEERDALVAENTETLHALCTIFMNRICDAKLLPLIPREIRVVASYIANEGKLLKMDTPILIASYIILRFINPAIATPEVYKVIEPNVKTKVLQRTLILISKVIQNIANGVIFGAKEQYMVSLNDCILENREKMNTYLMSLVETCTYTHMFGTAIVYILLTHLYMYLY